MAIAKLSELKQAPQSAIAQLPATFDPEAWHAMQARDTALIEDQIIHGVASKRFIYEFDLDGKKVRGVSVVGARELASEYGGIKSRIVASVDKTGDLFVFKSFEPLQIAVQIIPQLADQQDFYEVVVEVTDIKTGNSIQTRKKETKSARRRDGTSYERPHYDVIAESKAFRNGVLSLLNQVVLEKFMDKCLKAGQTSAEKTIDQLRDGCLRFAAANAVPLERKNVEMLTYTQLYGLGEAAARGAKDFKAAAIAVGLAEGEADGDGTVSAQPAKSQAAGPADQGAATSVAAASQGEGPSEADVLAMLDRAKTIDDLDTAMSLSEPGSKPVLKRYNERKSALTKGARNVE